jgi:hypothetical protein
MAVPQEHDAHDASVGRSAARKIGVNDGRGYSTAAG